MLDFSFIRLEPNFTKAKSESLPAISRLGYFNQIQLLPSEAYLQITNTPSGIAFGGNYLVHLVDCADNVIASITDYVAVSEFIDNKGINQIAFEIAPLGTDYNSQRLHFKFVHTVSDYVWYSNPVFISEYNSDQSSRFDYRSYTDHHGTANNIADYYQSIRLKCFYTNNDTDSTSVQYTSIIGKKVTSRVIQSEYEKYLFEFIDTFTYRRLNKLLTNQVIFIRGNRVSDKQTINSEDIEGNTNVFDIGFKTCMDYSETFTPSFQIHDDLELVSFSPFGSYTLASLPSIITGTFNRNISELTGTVELIDTSDDSVIATFTQSEITTAGSGFSIDIMGLITINGSYKVRINSGVFVSIFSEIFAGFEWDFTVSNGDYEVTEYDNTEYFTT